MILYRYIDGSGPRFATLALRSGERLFLSLVKAGLAIHRLHLWGAVPGKRLFAASADDVVRMSRVLRREPHLPPLPRASKQHRDDGAMDSFLDAALIDLNAVTAGKSVPGAVDALEEGEPRPLALFTRLALTCEGAAECVHRFERVRNIPG